MNARGPQNGGPPLVAVLDDDPSFLRSLGSLLRSHGYAAALFNSPSTFLNSLSSAVPACLVLDIQMPEMNGFEVQERLGALEICLPVIFITAHDTPQFRQRARTPETVGLLRKPFEPAIFLDVVRTALGLPMTQG